MKLTYRKVDTVMKPAFIWIMPLYNNTLSLVTEWYPV